MNICIGRERERESEEERWREYSWIWIQLENYQARTARTERKAHRRRVANISPIPPVPCDRIQARMELPAAGEHVFAVEGIEKKRIRKVTEREHVCEKRSGR